MTTLMEAYEKITLTNNSSKFDELSDALYSYLEQFNEMCDLKWLHIRFIRLTMDGRTTVVNEMEKTMEEEEEDSHFNITMSLFGDKAFAPVAQNILAANEITFEISYELEQYNRFYDYDDDDEDECLAGRPAERLVNGRFRLFYCYGIDYWSRLLPEDADFSRTARCSILELSSDQPKGVLLYEYTPVNRGQPRPVACPFFEAGRRWYAERFEMFVAIETENLSVYPLGLIQKVQKQFDNMRQYGFEALSEQTEGLLEISLNGDGAFFTDENVLTLIGLCRQILDDIHALHNIIHQKVTCRFYGVLVPEEMDAASAVIFSNTSDNMLLTAFYSY